MDDLEAAFEALRAQRKKHEPKGEGKKSTTTSRALPRPQGRKGSEPQERTAAAPPAPAQDRVRGKDGKQGGVQDDPTLAVRNSVSVQSAPVGIRKPSAAEVRAKRAIERQQPIEDRVFVNEQLALPPTTAAEAPGRLFGRFAQPEEGYKGIRPPPFVRDQVDPRLVPKRHAPGSLKVGDSVFYCNQRYWITQAPDDWTSTCHIQISTIATRPGLPIPDGAHVQMVHADALELAPIKGPAFTAQPTKHAVETEKRKKELGITHVGDDVGAMLQGKSFDEVYAIAAEYLGVPEKELRAKYGHLNPGQQRMLCGNRMRGWAKKRG